MTRPHYAEIADAIAEDAAERRQESRERFGCTPPDRPTLLEEWAEWAEPPSARSRFWGRAETVFFLACVAFAILSFAHTIAVIVGAE